jgi:hypoxanthine phosphoribosyltransferase
MRDLSFKEISKRIGDLNLPYFDVVIGIADGGTVPASLVAYQLGIELKLIKINYRDVQNNPIYDEPVILSQKNITNKKVLLVDDVSVSGKTLEAAIKILQGNSITTLTLKGKADYVLFPEISECVNWPWKLPPNKQAV